MTTLAAAFNTEIIRTKFQSMVDEMNVLLARSAYSTLMRESRDCSYEFLDSEGRLLGPPGSIIHGYSFQHFIRSVWRVYGKDDIKPGDIYISNHPYESFVHHAPDLAVMTPVFYEGELVAYSCSAAHKPDFGGAMPGSSYSRATELIQEGFLLPIVRYARRGKIFDEFTRIIQTNVRSPHLVLGDMNSQIGITKAAAKRIIGLLDRFGKDAVLDAFTSTLDGTEKLFRDYLSEWKDGSFSGEAWLDDDGSGAGDPVRLFVTITKKGSEIEFDFNGTDPQTRGPANMVISVVKGSVTFAMRESRDCSYEFLDAEGRLLGPPGSIIHGYSFQHFIRSVWRVYGKDDIKPGDIYISNHPYESFVHHAPDLAVMTPVFYEGELVAYSCSAAHKPDFGGAMPGSSYSRATELIQEGFLLPIVRYARRGKIFDEFTRIIQTNVRSPHLVLGDMNSQIGITKAAAKRIVELLDRFGKKEVLDAFTSTLDGTEKLFRDYLSEWKDGSFSGEAWLDDDGSGTGDPVRLFVTITKKGSEIEFDFNGTDPQTRGPANMVISVVKGSVTFALVSLIDPNFPFNDGMWRAIKLTFSERSVVSPEYPSPVGNCTQSMHRLMDLLVEVLGKFQPEKGVAHSGGSGGTLALSWPTGVVGPHPYTHYEILGSATAGSNQGDGESGIATNSSSNLFLAPIEIVENAAPVRLRRFEMVPDSGGPGKYRGGLSYRRVYEVLASAKLNRRADRVKLPSLGSDGGSPGRTGEFALHPGTDREEHFGGSGFYDLEAGDTFAVAGSGAGGYGDPFERDVEAVLEDVRAGWVTVESAASAYGVVIAGGVVDAAATKALRSERVP